MAKVFLDPGHGGQDSGAYAKGICEKVINLIVALEVKRLLGLNGVEVAMSRTTDTSVSLNERCRMANAWGANYFISIHHNAGGGIGYDVIHSIYKGKGQELANKVAEEFRVIGQKPNGVGVYSKQGSNGDYYAVIRETSMSAIITEYCFLDSSDYYKVDSQDKLMNEAKAIAKAICRQLGLVFKDTVEQPTPSPTPSKILYRVQVGAYSVKSNADKLQAELKSKGIDCFVKQVGNLYKVQCGAYSVRANADAMANRLKSLGYSCFITQ